MFSSEDNIENTFLKEWKMDRETTEEFELDLSYFEDLVDD